MMKTPSITHPFEIIRSPKRKRLSITIQEGKVLLLLPVHVPESEALAFLHKKSVWVQRKIKEHADRPSYQPKHYIQGERFFYLGKEYFLNIAYTKQPGVMVRDDQLFVLIRETHCAEKRRHCIQYQLRAWYWQQADLLLQQKSRYYAQLLSVHYQSIKTKQFKSRWGSCSIKGDIQYTWQIVMAPDSVISYLVVHELSHILHHNHSPAFWATVQSVMPEYKQNRVWLKKHGYLLRII